MDFETHPAMRTMAAASTLPFTLFLLCGFFVSSRATSPSTAGNGHDLLMPDRFHGWMARQGRSYPSADEKLRRFAVYKRNVGYIEVMNRDGRLGYELGENEFTDLTAEEFAARYTAAAAVPTDDVDHVEDNVMVITTRAGDVHECRDRMTANGVDNAAALDAIPSSVDWRDNGAVTPAKNQMECGAGWAFAAVATVESIWKIKKGALMSLSEQEILDCDPRSRGNPDTAFEWVVRHGLTTEAYYPYRGAKADHCDTQKTAKSVASVRGYRGAPRRNEAALAAAVARQPIAVAIDASGENMQHYKSGVYAGPCGTEANHHVALVGYGETEDGVKYWIAKNSWGQNWGDEGFFLMRRGVDGAAGLCGVALNPVYPTL
ncbi:hypothetical protein EJB05_40044, partial [Eragrostis curvula]